MLVKHKTVVNSIKRMSEWSIGQITALLGFILFVWFSLPVGFLLSNGVINETSSTQIVPNTD